MTVYSLEDYGLGRDVDFYYLCYYMSLPKPKLYY